MKRNYTEMSHPVKQDRPEKKMKTAYTCDPKLLPRVQQYLEARRDKKVVDLAAMADDLQSRFGEYGRKKRAAFRKSVEKAYEHILRTTQQPRKDNQRKRQAGEGNQEESGESSGEFSEENPEYATYEDTNAMNSLMRNFYAKPGSRPGSRPSSQPGSGASTPIGSRSPFRPSDPESAPTPLFTIDRSGNKSLKDALHPKSKTPVSSPKPKVKQAPQVIKSVGLQDFATEDGDDSMQKQTIADKNSSLLSADSPNVSRIATSSKDQELSDNQAETPLSKDVSESMDIPATPKKVDETNSGRPVKKRRKQDPEEDRKKKGPEVTQSKVTFADVGGNDKMLADVCKLLVHLKHPEVYRQLGVTPPRGFLLHGPPGCGKTLLAHAIAGELELPFIKVAATEIVSGVSGESEEKVRDTFQKAMTSAPCVLFIDEIDAITQKRENASKDMERRIVSQLLTCMDELNSCQTAHVLVIGATNRPDSIDPALRRAGRFDREISLGIPDLAARERILLVLCRELRLAPGLDLAHLARITPGYVGADLMALAREAAISAVNRVFKALQESRQNERVAIDQGQPSEGVHTNTTSQGPDQPLQTVLLNSSEHSEMVDRGQEDLGIGGNQGDVPMKDMQPASETTLISVDDDNQRENVLLEIPTVPPENTVVPQQTTDVPPKTPLVPQGITPEGMDIGEVQKDEQLNSSKQGMTIITNGGVLETKEESVEGKTESSTKKLDTGEQNNTFLQGLQQTVRRDTGGSDDLATVLSWLKDQPPLTDEQLQDLWIELADFELAAQSVQPSAKREGFATIPDVTWADIGALHDVREELQMAILAPVRHPEKFRALGLTSPPGILLAGPPGCGKTLLAKAVANESGINFISVKGPELLNMYVGESERAVRQVFQRARNSAPCVIFFDELDALCPRRAAGGEGGSSVRVVNQLLTEMDGLEERKQVFIMGATNRPDIIDPAVLRPGRLDKTLYVGLPGPTDRHDILRTVTKNGTKPALTPEVDLALIAADTRCDGYTGADLAALVREAAVTALRESMARPETDGDTTRVSRQHFNTAFDKIRPSVSEKDRAKYQLMNHRVKPS